MAPLFACAGRRVDQTEMTLEDLRMEIQKCHKCRLADTRTFALPGEGKTHAEIMLVAQAPGNTEDRQGKMFVGPSGRVLDEFLDAAAIDRKDIYMTNLVKCMLPRYRRPKRDEIEACSYYLGQEVELVDPEKLIPLGYFAAKYLFDNSGLPLPFKHDFHKISGRLFLAGARKILPLKHPAAALYNPEIKKEMENNYKKIGTLLHDCKWYLVCPMKRYYEQGQLDRKWIELYCKGDWERCVRCQSVEKGEYHPDWMLPDGTIDESLRALE